MSGLGDETSVFKPAGEDVRLLIAHPLSADAPGPASNMNTSLRAGVRVVAERPVQSQEDLLSLVHDSPNFNTFLLLADGGTLTSCSWLYSSTDYGWFYENPERRRSRLDPLRGRQRLHIDLEVLGQALILRASNALSLLGVCYFGAYDLAATFCDRTGAPACIAPQPAKLIARKSLARGYCAVIDTMQALKDASLNIQSLYDVLIPAIPDDVRQDLSVYPRMQNATN